MNKTTKGALGASAAAVLLLGGAGSLAFWTDDATVNGGSVNSGYLTIDPVNVAPNTTPCDLDWKHATNNATVVNVVPGDKITKKCTFTIKAQGDNLSATPTVPTSVAITPTRRAGGPATPITTFSATVGAVYALSGGTGPTGAFGAADKITEANNGQTLTATFTVTFPYGTSAINYNDTQQINAALSDLTVSLLQDKGTNNPNS